METPQGASRVHPILVIHGDGIGPEIMDATLQVLRFLEGLCGKFKLSFEIHEAGASSHLRTGRAISEETVDALARCKEALKGPLGLPCVRTREGTEAGLLGGILRVGFDLCANLRPIRHIPEGPSRLGERDESKDLSKDPFCRHTKSPSRENPCAIGSGGVLVTGEGNPTL